jgi:formylglycine-generating enzyme required for sulfatase activity
MKYKKVFRGGGWGNTFINCRAVNRNHLGPAYKYYGIGFRVVVDLAVRKQGKR